MKKTGSFLIRLLGLVVLLGIAAVLIGVPLAEKREEKRVRTMLLAVQEALQRFHVDEELYPKRMMNGSELVRFLEEKGFVEDSIVNPWTQAPFQPDDPNDWLRYRTDPLAETYELIVFRPGTGEVAFRLDSTENQSLE